MAKKIKEIPTNILVSYQQIIDFTSKQIYGLFQEIEKALKEKLISKKYRDHMEEVLGFKITKNNEISFNIDQELFKRIKNNFKGVTTMIDIPRLAESFEQEKIAFKKENGEEKKVPVKNINFKKGNEEIID